MAQPMWIREIAKTQRKLAVLRRLSWGVFAAELGALALCVALLFERQDLWLIYVGSLTAALALLHGVPRIQQVFILVGAQASVGKRGDRWRIGNYSEGQIRELIQNAIRDLPIPPRRVKVCVQKDRDTNAWTWPSMRWSQRRGTQVVWLTSGSLFYLAPNELQAVLLHEIGHHLRDHRAEVLGGWLAMDTAIHGFTFWCCAASWPGLFAILILFLIWRMGLWIVVDWIMADTAPGVEHLCDLYAARHAGSTPLINALLKVGEEQELTEVVLARVAKKLLHVRWIDIEELALEFAEVRPHGRIFHDNLFQHATALTKAVLEDQPPSCTSSNAPHVNRDLQQWLEVRRTRRKLRIRWRSFDKDDDGSLSEGEIASLCHALVTHPQHALVISDDELDATTHPPYRDRILVINQFGSPMAGIPGGPRAGRLR